MLSKIPLFAKCGVRDLEAIAQLMDEVEVPAGKVLMRQGEPGSQMFFIASGAVDVEHDGRIVKRGLTGAAVGEMALVSEGPRNSTVTTTSPARLLVLAHREFHSLMDGHPHVRAGVMDSLAQRIRELEDDTAH
jgi:CRP-like cAMP-binding protein